MSDFDVIVVGAGLAGNTAAYLLAKAGLGVLVVERSETIGGKNVTGGRMYSHSLERIFPDFAKEAPPWVLLSAPAKRAFYTYNIILLYQMLL